MKKIGLIIISIIVGFILFVSINQVMATQDSVEDTASVAEYPEDYYHEFDCGHRVNIILPEEAAGVWVKSDPATLSSTHGYEYVDSRFVLEAYSVVAMEGVPITNTWSCFFTGTMPGSLKQQLYYDIEPGYYVEVNENGRIDLEEGTPFNFDIHYYINPVEEGKAGPDVNTNRDFDIVVEIYPREVITTSFTVVVRNVPENWEGHHWDNVACDWVSSGSVATCVVTPPAEGPIVVWLHVFNDLEGRFLFPLEVTLNGNTYDSVVVLTSEREHIYLPLITK